MASALTSEGQPPEPDATVADLQRANAALRQQLADQRAERDVALAEKAMLASQQADRNDTYSERQVHQAATNEVLTAMAASPADPQPVFDLIATRARDICGSYGVSVMEFDGVMVRLRAWTGVSDDPGVREAYIAQFPRLPDRTRAEGRAILDRQVVHVRDYQNERELRLSPGSTTVRSNVAVPMRRGTEVIGVVVMGSRDVGGFSDSQVELLKTFAEQAVIAITSAAAHRELRESLERQTATTEVLETINSSPGDLQPVFEAILAKAMTLCAAAFGAFSTFDGQRLHTVATRGVPEAFARYRLSNPPAYGPGTGPARLIAGEDYVHDIDAADSEAYRRGDPSRRAIVDLGGARTILNVALRKDHVLLGTISIYRQEVRPFSDNQIALLQGFAAQAVIAVENARLFTELKESLEQQTATTEVLQVINSSTGNLAPVFEAILEKAHSLCDAPCGSLQLYNGGMLRAVADRGLPEELAMQLRQGHSQFSESDREAVQVADVVETFGMSPDDPVWRTVVQDAGLRTMLFVPLHREGAYLGRIVAARREVRPFTERQIALLKTFADQAVIAIQNARLFDELTKRTSELEESLEQQTATAEILRAISRSPTDVQPVLDAVVKAAVRFCGATDAVIIMRDEDRVFGAAHEGTLRMDRGRRFPLNREAAMGRSILDHQTCHLPDIEALDPVEFATARRLAAEQGFRAAVAAPLLREGAAIGSVLLRKPDPGPFTPQQIGLLETFAAQAVIAIENVRLFTELRESLDQQTATAELLQVINSAPGALGPVFEAMLEKAMRLCGASVGDLRIYDGDDFRQVAARGVGDAYVDHFRKHSVSYGPGTGPARILAGEPVVHIPDLIDTEAYRRRDPDRVALVELAGARASLIVPLIRDETVAGFIMVLRQEAGAFSDKQIALLQNFAAQAVIAMENARLLGELREALEQQTASSEILQVISQSPTDVTPVLNAVAKAAVRFCGAEDATISLQDGGELTLAAHEGPIGSEEVGRRYPLDGATIRGRAIIDCRTVHVPDAAGPEGAQYPRTQELARRLEFRAVLAAPMLRDEGAIGSIALRKSQPTAFTHRQIELLETFAAQAVIAIENVRLFTELRDSLEQQTATAEILRVISQSPTDVAPVLSAVARAALKFCGARDAQVALRDGDTWFVAAHEGPIEAVPGTRRLNRFTPPGVAMLDGKVVQVADLQSPEGDEFPEARELGASLGFRSALVAPLMRDDVSIGVVALRRPEPGTFTPSQVELLRSFAAQAVIAIENVRLFTELRDSLERLKAAQANLIQAEKMASLGQLTAGIAHEIKNPLNFVNNFAGLSTELLDELKQGVEALLAEPDDDKRAELQDTMDMLTGNLAKILEHGRRADGIVKSMLSHSRGGAGDWQESDLNALVEESLNLAYHGARALDKDFDIALERDFAPSAEPIEVVPQDVTRVLLNLFGNGFYAITKRRREGGEADYMPAFRVSTRDLGDAVEIRVRDNGIGILPEVRAKVFQPFFTTKPTGEGTGLGLSISYDIVTQQHGGTIEVESEPGSFTEFTVRLPRSRRVTRSGGAQ